MVFIARSHSSTNATRNIAMVIPSVRPSVCPSGVARNFSQGVRNSNWLHSPIFNRRPSLFLSRAELWQANASSLAALPQWKLHRSCGDASWRIHDGGGILLVAARTPSTFLTKNSASLSALMSVEAYSGLCHMTRLMNISARARGHTVFDLNGPLSRAEVVLSLPPWSFCRFRHHRP